MGPVALHVVYLELDIWRNPVADMLDEHWVLSVSGVP